MAAVTPIDPDLKDRVLSDIAGGMRPKAAAEKYGVKLGTIGQWCARAGLTLGVRKKAEKVAVKVKGGKVEKPPEPAPATRASGYGGSRQPVRAAGLGIMEASSMTPELRDKLRRGAWGLADTLAEVASNREARAAATITRAELVKAGHTLDLVDELCPMPAPLDMRQIDAAARALRATLEIAPGLAQFATDTGEATSGGLGADELAAMDAVLTPEPPALAVVEGGRAASEA